MIAVDRPRDAASIRRACWQRVLRLALAELSDEQRARVRAKWESGSAAEAVAPVLRFDALGADLRTHGYN